MDYVKVYYDICRRGQNHDRIHFLQENKIYYERHHIIPKCMGGNDVISNLAYLTAREHYLCHYLLYKHAWNNQRYSIEQQMKLANAFAMMANTRISKGVLDIGYNSHQYQCAKLAHACAGAYFSKRAKRRL